MEAFVELYRVWPDARVRERIEELVSMLIDPFLLPHGASTPALYRELDPVSQQVSYGHDIENAHLLLEACRRVGRPLPSAVVKRFADYVLDEGWDRKNGGLFYLGTAGGEATGRTKSWWVMAEAILGYAAVYEDSGDARYLEAAHDLWRYTSERFIDHELGGWYGELSEEGEVLDDRKGHSWKACYHETRALLHTSRILRRL
jgi:mannobiose 2-epimerase